MSASVMAVMAPIVVATGAAAAWLLAATMANVRRFWMLKDLEPIPADTSQRVPDFHGPWVRRRFWEQPWPDPTLASSPLTPTRAALYAHAAMRRSVLQRRYGIMVNALASTALGLMVGLEVPVLLATAPERSPVLPLIMIAVTALIVAFGVRMGEDSATYWAHVADEYAACAERLRHHAAEAQPHALPRPLLYRLRDAWLAFAGRR